MMTSSAQILKNNLLFLSGSDIPFIEGQVTIHQPSLIEIGYIGGDDTLYTGCELLKFSKDILKIEDKNNLSNQTDFNILMSIMREKNSMLKYNVNCALAVLNLIFPDYEIHFAPNAIEFFQQETKCGEINTQNFLQFKQLLIKMFCLEKLSATETQEVSGELAKKIAEKLARRQQKLAELQSAKRESLAIFSRYISILAVGEHKDLNTLSKYTVYQLFDEFQRFELKMGYDIYFKARLAGAQDMKEPDDWMKDIHSQG